MSVTVTISGDFFIDESYLSEDLFSEEAISFFQKSDVNIVNLECPIIDSITKENKIIKHGPHLHSNQGIFNQLSKINVTAVTLANNHILDYGINGLKQTVIGCKKFNISTVGVGENMNAAATPLLLESNNIKIAIVNFCENEWSVATSSSPGSNPLNIINNFTQIKKAKSIADFVLVIIHGGNEYYNLPSPRMVNLYRFFAENGADVVIGHHTHCFSGMEVHNGIPIFYGLGNMIFTNSSKELGWFKGLTLKLILKKDKPTIDWQIIPTTQSKENFKFQLAKGNEKEKILQEINNFNTIILDEKLLKENWDSFAQKKSDQYLYAFSAINLLHGRYLKGALNRLGLVKWLFPKKYLANIINYIACEAHLELTTDILRNKLFKK